VDLAVHEPVDLYGEFTSEHSICGYIRSIQALRLFLIIPRMAFVKTFEGDDVKPSPS